MTVVAALGDSLSCGEGVGLRIQPARTWVGLLAAALPGARLVRLAVAGARVGDVRTRQLPQLPGDVDLATVLAGLNDVGRAGFDPDAVAGDLRAVVAAAHRRGAQVLLGRLHDPAAVRPVPRRVATAVRARVAAVNATVDELARQPGVHVLDLGAVPVLARPGGWAADRIHPAEAGHRGMAAAAAGVLAATGRFAPAALPAGPEPRGPGRAERAWWTLRHGLPYALTHARDLGQPVASALLRRR
ncbi:GDSL-type esterase/lipase family protein [Blastococcus sp. SYSU D00695]